MNTQEQLPTATPLQRSGSSPRSSTKRNSGLFAFFKWFKPSTSKESIDSGSSTGSLESLGSNKSIKSAGTVASFNFIPPNDYENRVTVEKCIQIGPETDTYKARLKQRDKRREYDKNLTLRKKYNLFFNRDTFLRPQNKLLDDPENSRSLPLMTRAEVMEVEPVKVHRRTNSESSKVRRAGAYLHVKGKRKAPQPPGIKENSIEKSVDQPSTASLQKKKRLAPGPPGQDLQPPEEDAVLSNDSWKLDHGVLKPAKDETYSTTNAQITQKSESNQCFNPLSPSSSRSSFVEAPVSPRPWYKRHSSNLHVSNKTETKSEEKLPEVQYMRNSSLDLTLEDALTNSNKKKVDEKRKSGLSFLTNISELDREASEVIRNKKQEKPQPLNNNLNEIPEFMRPQENKINIIQETLSSPNKKRTSARDLIAKFNAITGVSKSTAFGGNPNKDRYFGKQHSLEETRRQESLLDAHKRRIDDIDKKKNEKLLPLMKSESASAVKLSSETKSDQSNPNPEKASWKCPKCNIKNEYWRIICQICSAIKPYFDEFAPSTKIDIKPLETKTESPVVLRRELNPSNAEKWFERSKTQIGFSALANYRANNEKKLQKLSEDGDKSKVDNTSKKEEREKLKKMLIEMKNSLPKRKSNILVKQNSRSSIILENPEEIKENKSDKIVAEPIYETFSNKMTENNKEIAEKVNTDKEIITTETKVENNQNAKSEKTQEQKVASILIGTSTTIYENIKLKKDENRKPTIVKVSPSLQTNAIKKPVPEFTIRKLIEDHKNTNIYEPMKVKDFEDIYSDKNGTSPANIYANLAKKDELSLFFNVPKTVTDSKNNVKNTKQTTNFNKFNADTIQINRLLRRLETSIAKGDMIQAAIFAKELAQLKVNCSVIRQKVLDNENKSTKKGFQIEMYVEDKVSHRGPFPIEVTETQTVSDLKEQIFRDFEIPVDVQKWILGRELVTDERKTLKEHQITAGCPVFLYLVAPDKNPEASAKITTNGPLDSTKNILETPKAEDKPSTSNIPKILHVTTKTEQTQIANTNKVANKIILVTSKEVKPQIVNVVPTLGEKKVEPKIINVVPKSTEPQNINEVKEIPKIPSETSESKTGMQIRKLSMENIKNIDFKNHRKNSLENNALIRKFSIGETKNNEIKNVQMRKLSIEDTKKIISKFIATPSVSTTEIKIDVIPVVRKESKLEAQKVNLDEYFPRVKKTGIKKDEIFSEIVKNEKINNVSEEVEADPETPSTKIENEAKLEVLSRASETTKINKTIENSLSSSKIPTRSVSAPSSIPQNLKPFQNYPEKEAPKAQAEDLTEFDRKVINTPTEWECHLCTLLNPISSNICAVCATVRLNKSPRNSGSSTGEILIAGTSNSVSAEKEFPERNSKINLEEVTATGLSSSSKNSCKKKRAPPTPLQNYQMLVNLDSADLVANNEPFECVVCFTNVEKGEGVTLRECLHQFCKQCLAHTVEFAEEAEVKCPFRNDTYSCNIALQDREIKSLVTSTVYEQHLAKSMAQAENGIDKSFHCKTPDCKGWCIYEDNVNDFRCPVCKKTNCLTCQAIHMGVNCKEYQERIKCESALDEDAKRTREFLEEMVEKGEAIACPTCKVILMKKWGCDWLRCSMCKTEICWVTRGPRWGPAGKGDTSGGCKCGEKGVKCHPQCNYCH